MIVAKKNEITTLTDGDGVLDSYQDSDAMFNSGGIAVACWADAIIQIKEISIKEVPDDRVSKKSSRRRTPKAKNETTDAFQPETVSIGDHIRIQEGSQETFSGTLTVLERRGERFVAQFDLPNNTREIHGTIKDGRISWLAKDVKVIENHGHQGHDHFGTIEGEEISLSYSGIAVTDGKPVSGEVKLRLQR